MNAEIVRILQLLINGIGAKRLIIIRTVKNDGTIEIEKAELKSISNAILNALEKSS